MKSKLKTEIIKITERLVTINEDEELTYEEDIKILNAIVALYESVGQ